MADRECTQPDVMALEETAAREALRHAGITRVRTALTSPPWPGEGVGPRRVVRQTTAPDGTVDLVVAHVRHLGRKRDAR